MQSHFNENLISFSEQSLHSTEFEFLKDKCLPLTLEEILHFNSGICTFDDKIKEPNYFDISPILEIIGIIVLAIPIKDTYNIVEKAIETVKPFIDFIISQSLNLLSKMCLPSRYYSYCAENTDLYECI